MNLMKKSDVIDYLYIFIGTILYAIGFTIFILPHKVVIGGMAGWGTLVFYATGEHIPVAVTMYGTNIILLLIGFKMLGREFVCRSIFGATMLSLLIGSIEHYFTSHPPLITDITMSIVMGSVFCGFGIGVYYNHHGTTGGTDIVAAIMTQLSSLSPGRVLMIFDMSIVACSFFLPFDGNLEERLQVRAQVIIYGWMAIFIYGYITDKFMAMGRRTVQFIIISDHWEKIGERITNEAHRGVTLWDGKGFWTRNERKMLLVWARKYEAYNISFIVKEVDPEAYVTHSYVNSVLGRGFDEFKMKNKKKKRIADK
jgi:uncharacterized membrane-anchored protein YitT (DUF2179 family)